MNLKLRSYRESRGLTQMELAKVIGKSFRTIQSWERGESFPNAEAIWTMCEFFSTDPNELLGWYDEHPGDRPAAPITRDERSLVDNYRACTPERRRRVMDTAQDQCSLSVGEPYGQEGDRARRRLSFV